MLSQRAIAILMVPFAFATVDAHADSYIRRNLIQNASGACVAASQASDSRLLKRPLALVNNSPSVAAVTCSLVANFLNPNLPIAVIAYATNRGTMPATMTCTLWNGNAWAWKTLRKTFVAPVNELTSIGWQQSELQYKSVNISCLLPPKVELDAVGQLIDEPIPEPSP